MIVLRHEQQADHGEREGDAAEEHRAARGGAGGGDRVEPLAPVQPLLAVAREHEQRVVDPERQPHRR